MALAATATAAAPQALLKEARTTSLLLELRGATAAREKEGTVTVAEERAAIAPIWC
jgi:hypothetical protein